MDKEYLKNILKEVEKNNLSVDNALDKLIDLPFKDLGYAKIDNHRNIRVGYPEVIYCEGKTTDQTVNIIKEMIKNNDNILATRANKEIYDKVHTFCNNASFNLLARTITIKAVKKKTFNIKRKKSYLKNEYLKNHFINFKIYKENKTSYLNKIKILNNSSQKSESYIAILTAGTSDIPVAEEAKETCEIFGNKVKTFYDVGVAGIHRLFDKLDLIRNAKVIIVIAGMEGALASVVSGLVDKPIIAVPTSVGYGANFNGLAPLLSMLNSCASGVTVVNIDNGFGAGYFASMINKI
ncbi:nickel pincer cofactor biosynthesis protein LarB [Clostridium fallax]|uniref:PurE domain-containing protein n=1 Tax=Clostridium fallax TaxID=1533 RepID=A0A1M4XXH1_9CLOT|nr:nickel pincer cofactor biosynthesis protein LarB [Clostridium fallax]SHE98130.1 hypothetical protein SAMN05443638_1221 [Clostridium fallax]SQB06468.1 PurE-like protein [Clostridium fallax]